MLVSNIVYLCTSYAINLMSAVAPTDCLTIDNLIVSEGRCPLTLTCEASFNFSQPQETSGIGVTWLLNGKDVDKEGFKSTEDYDGSATYYLTLPCNISNFGNLTCLVSIEGEQNVSMQANKTILLSFPVAPKITESKGARVNASQAAGLSCTAQGFPPPEITWIRRAEVDERIETQANKLLVSVSKGATSITSKLEVNNTQRIDNGTYVCLAISTAGKDTKAVGLFVQTKPEVSIDYALGVGNGSLYLNWTLNNGNLPITKYHIKYMKEGTEQWRFNPVAPDVSTTNLVINGLEPDVAYVIQMEAENAMGRSHPSKYPDPVKTLSYEAMYIPVADVKGSTSNSFTLGWTSPPEEIRHLIGHYLVSYKDVRRETEATVHVASTSGPLVHLFTDLQPATMYVFRVRACQRYTVHCGNFSVPVNGTTIDGAPSPPRNVVARCERDGDNFYVSVTWDPPAQPNGQLVHFTVRSLSFIFHSGITHHVFSLTLMMLLTRRSP